MLETLIRSHVFIISKLMPLWQSYSEICVIFHKSKPSFEHLGTPYFNNFARNLLDITVRMGRFKDFDEPDDSIVQSQEGEICLWNRAAHMVCRLVLYCFHRKDASVDLILADKIVKVPEMAESISEGTLKQWSKREFLPTRQAPKIGGLRELKIA